MYSVFSIVGTDGLLLFMGKTWNPQITTHILTVHLPGSKIQVDTVYFTCITVLFSHKF